MYLQEPALQNLQPLCCRAACPAEGRAVNPLPHHHGARSCRVGTEERLQRCPVAFSRLRLVQVAMLRAMPTAFAPARPLSAEQMRYAATDASACLRVLDALQQDWGAAGQADAAGPLHERLR